MFYSRWLDRKLVAAWIPGAMPSKHRLGRTLEPDFLPVLGKKKKEKVWSYICLTNCLVVYAAVMGVAFFQSASRFAKRIVAHYWLVSCQMKTDVVLLACHKPP